MLLKPCGVNPVLQDGDYTSTVCFSHGITCFLLSNVIITSVQAFSSFVHLESRAIVHYIASKYYEVGTPLYGHTLQEKATVEQ